MDPVLVAMFGMAAGVLTLIPAVWLFDKVEAWWDDRTDRRNHPAE